MRLKKKFSIPGLFTINIDIGTSKQSSHTSTETDKVLAPKRELVEIDVNNDLNQFCLYLVPPIGGM